jgi:hypothetical protein
MLGAGCVLIARYPRQTQTLYAYLLTQPFSRAKPPEREGVLTEWIMSDISIRATRITGIVGAVFFAIAALGFLLIRDL